MKRILKLTIVVGLLIGTTHSGAQGLPVTSTDFDGDGKADIAVWRPSDGFWHIFFLATNNV